MDCNACWYCSYYLRVHPPSKRGRNIDYQRGPRKSLPAFWGALQIVAIVVNYISRVSVSVFVLVRVPYISLDCLDLVSAASRRLSSLFPCLSVSSVGSLSPPRFTEDSGASDCAVPVAIYYGVPRIIRFFRFRERSEQEVVFFVSVPIRVIRGQSISRDLLKIQRLSLGSPKISNFWGEEKWRQAKLAREFHLASPFRRRSGGNPLRST